MNDQVVQYETDGFAIFRNVIDRDLLTEARAHVEWLCGKYPELRPEHLHHPLMRDDAFWVRLIADERLLAIARRFLGDDLVCFTAHYICKPPRDGMAVLWHQDGAYWKLDPPEAMTLWLALDESTPENGCLRMIPGSHRRPLHPLERRRDVPNMLASSIDAGWVDESAMVDVVLNPGDVSIHHPNIIHGSEPNTSPSRRCGLDMGFMRASGSVSNEGLYLDPLLVCGAAHPQRRYRPWPLFDHDKTIPFRGHEGWDERARAMNRRFAPVQHDDEPPLKIAKRMMARLEAGTVKA